MVVADNLAVVVERAYEGEVEKLSSASAWFATVAFGGQIFADFAGYSGIAIGLAMTLGLRFPENFRAPYLSAGLSEFWTRWHITLSSWLRDYLYISLGGNRQGALRTHANLLITMLLGGLWHGASWTFLAWGGLHGLGLSVERIVRGRTAGRSNLAAARGFFGVCRGVIAVVVTYVFVHLTWVFFRAADFDVAAKMLSRMFVAPFTGDSSGTHLSLRYATLLLPIVALHVMHYLRERLHIRGPAILRAIAAGLMVTALFVVRRGEARDFVYFQF